MEQQMVNYINSRWTKDINKRREVDINKFCECFRVLCSSRNSTLCIITSIKEEGYTHRNEYELKENLAWIYDWVTSDCINNVIKKYEESTGKDTKKVDEYKAEVPLIKEFLEKL
ncbi:MAG: hypothetical protein E7B49_00765, partial [Clostridium sp.]|nr:hypothetical protein [Clostridium sp.]